MGAHHDERRREIAEAVLAVVAEGGLAAVSLTTVASRAGVSAGRVQHYFRTKADLVEAAFERGGAFSAARIRDRVDVQDLSQADPRSVLTVVLGELLPYDDASRAHLRVRHFFNAQALADTAIADRVRALYAGLHEDLADLILQTGASTTDRARQTAVRLTAIVEGLAYYVLIGACDLNEAQQQLSAELSALPG
ncbi:TetR family transcriptional regulator [Kribbella speibonae]|uniref:TetR family transcriptional regulator n=1 Tax=Kribbella speibonae TaxID=1572660 RepID=A0ABY2AI42_9ACTN|nr:TetR family transcriptional regulator [Kribbella speibonae]